MQVTGGLESVPCHVLSMALIAALLILNGQGSIPAPLPPAGLYGMQGPQSCCPPPIEAVQENGTSTHHSSFHFNGFPLAEHCPVQCSELDSTFANDPPAGSWLDCMLAIAVVMKSCG